MLNTLDYIDKMAKLLDALEHKLTTYIEKTMKSLTNNSNLPVQLRNVPILERNPHIILASMAS